MPLEKSCEIKSCSKCAHRLYCLLGADCVNEDYKHFMSDEDVKIDDLQ